jgi:predicted NAD/FAD-dependent oxidoreductase
MDQTSRIAVIGAGLAGLTAARALADRGRAVTVFDKSRGLGGRLATRRTREGFDFDHGAPAVHGAHEAFRAFVTTAEAEGRAARWDGVVVGLPGMSGLVGGLAVGLDVRFGAEVEAIARDGAGWSVAGERFAAVIVAVPAPQAARLCAAAPRLVEAAQAARMSPCWTLLAAFDDARADIAPPAPFETALRASARPGRAPAPDRWVAHAALDWTEAHLELEKPAACDLLLPSLAAALGVDPAAVLYAAAHRWRYARTAVAVGEACVAQDGMILAGDWLLGPDAGDAFASGSAAAAAVAD